MPKSVAVSFEFFPPSDDAATKQWWHAVQHLAPLRPKYVSVTYGADGSTRERTKDCVARILRDTNLVAVPHLTCIGASREEILDLARDYWRQGVRHLVALRGDAPALMSEFAGRFAVASELVAALKTAGEFELSVAAYPEGHPETPGIAADVENLQRKVDAGASQAITQFFFDTDVFLRYRDRCAAAGIRVGIIPGILPIARFAQMVRFARCCGASVPNWLTRCFEGLEHDPGACRAVATSVAIEQVQRLRRHGVEEFHFYTLNRADVTYAVCQALGLRASHTEAQLA